MLAAVGLWAAVWRAPQPGPPADRPIPLSDASPLKVVAMGTSLTALYDWPDRLQDALAHCLGRPVTVTRIAEPGRPVTWGRDQIDTVLAENADLILIEFAINDADIRDGVPLAASIDTHAEILNALRAAQPRPQVMLMTMSPAHGLRGLIRPRLWAHYQSYRDLAGRFDTGLVDAYPRWLAQPGWKDAFADGLHPTAEATNRVLLPAILNNLGCPTS